MFLRRQFLFLSSFALLFSFYRLFAASGTFKVTKTFNNQEFSYELVELEKRDMHRVFKITYPSPVQSELETNNTVHGEFFLPNDIPEGVSCPAVLVNHVLDGGFNIERMMCSTLANNGVPAMFIMLPYYGPRGNNKHPKQVLENAEKFLLSLEQAILDNRRAVDILQARKEVNAKRIGIAGGSLGAIMSASVSGFEDRIERAFLLLGGGNLQKIFRHKSKETAAFGKLLDNLPEKDKEKLVNVLEKIDPLSQAKALQKLSAQNKLKMICAAEDHVIPPETSQELADAAKCEITWIPGVNHYTVAAQSPYILSEMTDFFTSNPNIQWRNNQQLGLSADPEKNAFRLLSSFFKDLSGFFSIPAASGKAKILDLQLSFRSEGTTFNCDLNLIRGAQERFKVSGNVPKLGSGEFGQDKFPWIAGANNSLFVGSENFDLSKGPESYISPEQLVKFNMIKGVLGTAAIAPEMLKSLAEVSASSEIQETTKVVIDINDPKYKSKLNVIFDKNGIAKSFFLDSAFAQVSVNVKKWDMQADATEALFQAKKEALPGKQVEQEKVLQMIAAVYERILEEINIKSF